MKERDEDTEAILRRRQFLIQSALAGAGLGLALAGGAWAAGTEEGPAPPAPGPCLSPPRPGPCLSLPPGPRMRVVRDPAGAFAISVPEDWQVQPQANVLVATSPDQEAQLVAMAAPRASGDLLQVVLSMIQSWQEQVPSWRLVGHRAAQVSGQPAVVLRAEGQPGGTASTADYALTVGPRHQVVVSIACRKEAYPRFQATFAPIIASLQLLGDQSGPGPQPCLSTVRDPQPCLEVMPPKPEPAP